MFLWVTSLPKVKNQKNEQLSFNLMKGAFYTVGVETGPTAFLSPVYTQAFWHSMSLSYLIESKEK